MTTTVVGTSTPRGFDINQLPRLQFDSGTIVSFAGHHVIPTAVFENSIFFGAPQNAGLWDNSSFALNGVALPTNGPNGNIFNPETGMPRHAGK